MNKESTPFDQAASVYDQSRALPRDVEDGLVRQLVNVFKDSGPPILDVGTGTGRLALQLTQETAWPVFGVDLSLNMLGKARSNKGMDVPFQAICADALHLPFPVHQFRGVIMSAVLHFVADWKMALLEAIRVLSESGILMIMLGRRHKSDTPLRAILRHLRQILDVTSPDFPDIEEMRQIIESQGCQYRDLSEVTAEIRSTPREALAFLEADAFPITWNLDPEARRKTLGQIRSWTDKEWPDHDQEIVAEATWKWYCFIKQPIKELPFESRSYQIRDE